MSNASEVFGLWDIACYFVSENVQTSVVAASTYKALMAGFDSGVENSYVNVWKQDNTENTPALLEYLRYCIHPRFSIPGDDQFFEVEKSVEMISSAIAEMRTYGEGFIIVDQSPTAVDVSAVKNTNTKIIMRLPDYEDCKIAGLSMGLNDSQIREISRFPMGVAVVYQNNWVEAVLTQIDKSEEQYHQTDLITDDYALAVIKGQLAVELVFQYETGLAAEEGFQLDDLLEIINSSDINASKKQDIVQSMVDWCSCFEREAPVNGSFAAKLAEFISCNGLFEALPIRFAKDYKNEPKITRDCIDKKDLASIRNWHSRVYDHLDSYVLLTDENIKNHLCVLLHFRKFVMLDVP